MRDVSLTIVRGRYLESKQKDRGIGNYAHEAERVITSWLKWCQQRDPPVTSAGDLHVRILCDWTQSL